MHPIHLAIENIEDENVLKGVVETLLTAGADIEAKDNDGWTPLMHAIHFGHIKIVETLLRSGANIEARNKNGHTPLTIATDCGNEEIVEILLKAGPKK